MELEEEKTGHCRKPKALLENCVSLDKQLLDLSDNSLEETAFRNVVGQLEKLVLNIWAFQDSFKFVARIESL